MEYFLEVFHNTPFWVYLIFPICIFLGIRSRKPRTVPFVRVLIPPFLFIGWSFGYMAEKYGVTLLPLRVWFLAMVIGTWIGWVAHLSTRVRIDRKKKRITLPGTWSVLILSVLLYLSKYSFGYYHAIAEEAENRLLVFGSDLFISGTISGIFLGKFFCFLKKIYEEE
jgi:hypothetical protein